MDPRMVPKGGSQEYNFGEQYGERQPNMPGVYFHPHAQKFVETAGIKRPDGSKAYHADQGKIQADAFVQMGYRPADEEESGYYKEAQKAAATVERIRNSRTTTVMSSMPKR